jgi:hypothetical protein
MRLRNGPSKIVPQLFLVVPQLFLNGSSMVLQWFRGGSRLISCECFWLLAVFLYVKWFVIVCQTPKPPKGGLCLVIKSEMVSLAIFKICLSRELYL